MTFYGIMVKCDNKLVNMDKINLNQISQLISQKLGKNIVITNIEPAGSGYHSDGFKLTTQAGQRFFIKRVKSHDLGFEFPERKIYSLLVSDGMGKRVNLSPKPIGVILTNQDQGYILPDIDDNTAIYHVQEYEDFDSSYSQKLQAKKDQGKSEIDQQDIKELEKVVELLSKIHAIKHPVSDPQRLKALYNDSLRNVISNPELTLVLLQSFPADHLILPRQAHKDYLGLMLNQVYKWENRYDRLSALHGDCWGANLFFKQDKVYKIDFSRMPWGDPGVDVGWWLSQYIWLYHETRNEYFKELGEKFLQLYEQKTGDREIREAVAIILGLLGIINLTPLFYQNLNLDIAKSFYNHIIKVLEAGKFSWPQ